MSIYFHLTDLPNWIGWGNLSSLISLYILDFEQSNRRHNCFTESNLISFIIFRKGIKKSFSLLRHFSGMHFPSDPLRQYELEGLEFELTNLSLNILLYPLIIDKSCQKVNDTNDSWRFLTEVILYIYSVGENVGEKTHFISWTGVIRCYNVLLDLDLKNSLSVINAKKLSN